MYKTHNCGELRLTHVGQTIKLAGWMHKRRDHGGLIFIDLRDRSGLVQITIDPSNNAAYEAANKSRAEYVLQITGTVRARPAGLANPNLPSGEIEVI
ncbi:MAG TPA: OB-fold nucleic acid binding domain-containing protein, partial [Anaerolineae bacterium]|nr:OB-fold nucleic acid binding domain-containing protein [Anaerolineae bacterium]